MPSPSGRRIALAAMAAALVAYVVMHTPLRDPIAGALGFNRRTCYFCLPPVTGFHAPDSLSVATLLLLAAVAAWALAERFPGPAYERLLVFGLTSLALVTVPAAMLGGLASLVGETYLRPPAGPLLAAIPAAALTVARVRAGWRPSWRASWRAPWRLPGTPLLWALGAAACLIVVAQSSVALLHPPAQGDALTYHAPLGVLFWSGGNLTSLLDRSPETWGLAHPGTAELWYGALRVLGGERLANLGQVPFALLGALAVYAFTRRTGLMHGAAAAAGCAFLVVPMVALQVGTQANDLTGAALVMTAVALASAPVDEWSLERAAVLGLALGLAAATKLALVPSVAAIGLFVVVSLARHRRQAGPAAIAVLALAVLVVVTPWWARNMAREGNPLFPQSLPVYGHGVDLAGGTDLDYDFVERRFAWPLYPIIEPIDDRSGFGALLAIALVPGLLAALAGARRRPLGVYALTLMVTLVSWWAYSHHEPRFLLAYAGLALALVPWALLAVPRRRRPLAAGLMVVAAAFTVAVTVDQQIVPLARQPVKRAEFYDRVYGVDPAAESLPEEDGILLHTGYGLGSIDYASYYPLLGPSQERLVVQLDADVARGSRAAVIRRMRQHGVRYAYVQALPGQRREVERLFGRPDFRLVHASTIVRGERLGVRRTAFRRATRAEADGGIRRYLFRLVRSSS